MRSNSDNPKVGKEFQEFVCALMRDHFQKEFILEKPIPIGDPPKPHKFDCVSTDGRTVIECKCYTWTNTGNAPSAKFSTLNEAVFYMSYLPRATRKIIAINKSLLPNKTESLAEYYCRTRGNLLKGIEVVEVDDLGSFKWIMEECNPC